MGGHGQAKSEYGVSPGCFVWDALLATCVFTVAGHNSNITLKSNANSTMNVSENVGTNATPTTDEYVTCCICLEKCVSAFRWPGCGHKLHSSCAFRWVLMQRYSTCPLCRGGASPTTIWTELFMQDPDLERNRTGETQRWAAEAAAAVEAAVGAASLSQQRAILGIVGEVVSELLALAALTSRQSGESIAAVIGAEAIAGVALSAYQRARCRARAAVDVIRGAAERAADVRARAAVDVIRGAAQSAADVTNHPEFGARIQERLTLNQSAARAERAAIAARVEASSAALAAEHISLAAYAPWAIRHYRGAQLLWSVQRSFYQSRGTSRACSLYVIHDAAGALAHSMASALGAGLAVRDSMVIAARIWPNLLARAGTSVLRLAIWGIPCEDEMARFALDFSYARFVAPAIEKGVTASIRAAIRVVVPVVQFLPGAHAILALPALPLIMVAECVNAVAAILARIGARAAALGPAIAPAAAVVVAAAAALATAQARSIASVSWTSPAAQVVAIAAITQVAFFIIENAANVTSPDLDHRWSNRRSNCDDDISLADVFNVVISVARFVFR